MRVKSGERTLQFYMSMFKETYPKDELPYDKFIRLGAESLSDAELLAIMLRTGTKTKTPIDLGRDILKLFGNQWGLLGLHHFSLRELMKVKGVGEVKAIQLLCIAEIAKRISYRKAELELNFRDPQTIAAYYMEQLRHCEKEKFVLILLNNRSQLIHDEVLSIGTVNATLVSPREIFIEALKAEASNIIILHNHPSGDPTPSRQDLLITNKIKEVSGLVEIPLIDHIIIGDNQYFSFKQKGLL